MPGTSTTARDNTRCFLIHAHKFLNISSCGIKYLPRLLENELGATSAAPITDRPRHASFFQSRLRLCLPHSNDSTQTAAAVEYAVCISRERLAYNGGQPRVWNKRRPFSAAASTTNRSNTHVDTFLPLDPAAMSFWSVVPESVDIRAACTGGSSAWRLP